MLPRLYPILDTAICRLPLEDAAAALLAGGARILQIRHKGHFTSRLFETVEAVAALSRGAGAALVVNDRADIAAMAGAGVHVGQDDLPPAEARLIVGGGRLLGFSTHTEAQLREAIRGPADYLALGPVFATGSKENPDPVVGLSEFARLRPLSNRPVVAIGGMTIERGLAAIGAGADSVAVIGKLFEGVERARDLEQRTRAFVEAFR